MKKIWISPPHLTGNEVIYIQEALNSNWIAPMGPENDLFENEIVTYTGARHAVSLSSATAALHLALLALNIGVDDIVLCSTFTFAASANPITYLKAIPVFIDSEPNGWNLCPDALETAIKYFIKIGKKPKAIIGVHIYGMPMELDVLMALSEQYEIPLIEDAAEALGSTYKGQKLGSFGKMSIISFNGNKIITTSGGGMLLSFDEKMIQKARFLASQAKNNMPYYSHSAVGYNYGMSNILAGVGRAQLEAIDSRVIQRRANFEFYQRSLAHLPGISFQKETEKGYSNRWLTCIQIDPTLTQGITPQNIMTMLAANQIETRLTWKPLHQQPVFKGSFYFGSDVAEKLFQNGLCLPSGSDLSENDLQRVCAEIIFVFKQKDLPVSQ